MKICRFSAGRLIVALLAALMVTNAWATHRSEAERAIAEAKAAHEKAASVQAASPETAKMIETAEGLLPSRQYTKAVGIATKAKMQDTFAYEQATSGEEPDTEARDAAEQAIADADAARKKAAAVGGEWRDTAKMIKTAAGLAKSGRFEEAIELAEKARRQGELGYAQSMNEKDAGFPSYVVAKP